MLGKAFSFKTRSAAGGGVLCREPLCVSEHLHAKRVSRTPRMCGDTRGCALFPGIIGLGWD